jgi:hypothetical protein
MLDILLSGLYVDVGGIESAFNSRQQYGRGEARSATESFQQT